MSHASTAPGKAFPKGQNSAQRARLAWQASHLRSVIEAVKGSRHVSLQVIATELNARGIAAPGGGRWNAVTVARVWSAS